MMFVAPKNFKSGRLISNKYTFRDLLLLVGGIILSVLLILIYIMYFFDESDNIIKSLLYIILFTLPGILMFSLVQPNGIYHNFYTFFYLLLIDIFSHKDYTWGGILRNANSFEKEEE